MLCKTVVLEAILCVVTDWIAVNWMKEELSNSRAACEWIWALQGGEQHLLMCHSYRHSKSCTCTVPTKPLPENWCSFILTHCGRARALLGFQSATCVWSVFVSTARHTWNVPCWCWITKALPEHGLSKFASKTTAAMHSKSSWEVSLSMQESLLEPMYSDGKVLDLEVVTLNWIQ